MIKKIKETFRAFKYRNYRLFFGGEFISLVGTWIQNTAISWLVYNMTNSALTMGVIMFINAMPTLVVMPFAGVIVDRFNKHKMMIFLQILFMIQAFLIAILTLLNVIQIWHIIILGVLLNTIASFDMPLRQAFVVQLVDDNCDLCNAISLNSSCFNLARLIGPALAGAIIAFANEGVCFLINAISYIPVIFAICAMRVSEKVQKPQHKSVLKELKEGFLYAIKTPQISTILLYLAIISFIGMTYPLFMPILARDILSGQATTLGYLMSAAGLGALLSSLLLASKKTINSLPKILLTGAFLFSFCFILLGLSRVNILSISLMFFAGLGISTALISSNTLIQYVVEDDKRGRIMSLHSIAFIGTVPISNLFAGSLAQYLGVLNTFILFGAIMLVISIYFTRKVLRLKF